MKREKNRNAQDMMTLEGDSIPQPVRKKGRLRLKAKHHRRLLKGLAAASACAILVGGTFGINALFFNEAIDIRIAGGVCDRNIRPSDGRLHARSALCA